jgi:hypothetical protein
MTDRLVTGLIPNGLNELLRGGLSLNEASPGYRVDTIMKDTSIYIIVSLKEGSPACRFDTAFAAPPDRNWCSLNEE